METTPSGFPTAQGDVGQGPSSEPVLNDPSQESLVYADQVRLLFADAYTGLVASFFNAALLTFIQWGHVPGGIALGWLGYMFVVIGARLGLVRTYQRSVPHLQDAPRWCVWYGLGALATGIGWGSTGIIFTPASSVPHQFFTTFVLAGMAAAAMTVLSPVYLAYVGYLLTTLVPVTAFFLRSGDVLHVTAAVIIGVYLLFLLKAGRTHNRFVRTSLSLALEKSSLVSHLGDQNRHVETLNEELRREILEHEDTEKALQFRLEFESLLTSISTRFINLPTDRIDRGILRALGQLAEFTGVERAFLALHSEDRTTVSLVHEWHVPEVEPIGKSLEGRELGTFPWWLAQMENLETICIPDMEALPPEAAAEKEFFQSIGIRSVIAVPLASGSLPLGFLGFESGTSRVSWERDTLTLLRIVSEMFVNALQRKRTQTELERARMGAEAAAKAKANFLANMSHEIRTPIHGVLGMLSLLKRSDLKNTERQYAQTAHRSAEVLLGIIDDILDFSKIEAGKLEIEAVEFDLREVVEDAAFLLSERAQNKGLDLNCLVQNNTPQRFIGDPNRLRQVLVNLVSNGVKFTDSGSVEIRVSAERVAATDATLFFEVRDTGIGIGPDAQRNLFDPFTQADVSSTRRYGGTGLGLAISKQLVGLMKGKIGAQSKINEGSTFWFRLDLPTVTAPAVALSPVLRGLHLLVVEDNALLRTSLVHYLDGWKIQYSATGNAEQALHLIQKAAIAGVPYEFIIIGKQMTGMTPIQFASALLKDASIPKLPVVLLSPVNDVHLYDDVHNELTVLTLPVRHGALFHVLVELCGDIDLRGRADHSKDAVRQPKDGESGVSFTERRILLVEDNLVNQQVATEMLSVIGIEVDIASNGQEALDRFKTEAFDLVFMDCQMPVMDGLQATRLIREYERNQATRVTPIVALTASAMIGDREKCISAGMNDYLAKPFRLVDLKAMLLRWLA